VKAPEIFHQGQSVPFVFQTVSLTEHLQFSLNLGRCKNYL